MKTETNPITNLILIVIAGIVFICYINFFHHGKFVVLTPEGGQTVETAVEVQKGTKIDTDIIRDKFHQTFKYTWSLDGKVISQDNVFSNIPVPEQTGIYKLHVEYNGEVQDYYYQIE